METIPTVVLYLVSIAAVIYTVTQAVSLIHAIRQPKVVHRVAIRKQIANCYLDLDFNLVSTDDFEACVSKTISAIDMAGVAFEKVKSDVEAEQERKRQAVPSGPYADPAQQKSKKSR